MFVKICGTTNEEDALLAVALGADAVGFVFAVSPRQVSFGKVRDIVCRIPHDVLTVGVFRNELPDRVVKIVRRAGLQAAQLHGHETPEETSWIADRVPTTIKAFSAGHPNLQRLKEYNANIVLIDGANPGSGEMFDWSLAEDAPIAGHKLMLAGGLNPENVVSAIGQVRPWAVDVSSGVEERPGHKDPAKMKTFIDMAKSANTTGQNLDSQGAGGLDAGGALDLDDELVDGPYNWEMDAWQS